MKRQKYAEGGSANGMGTLVQGGTSFLTQVFSLIDTLGDGPKGYSSQPVVTQRQTSSFNPYSKDFGDNNLPKFALGGNSGGVPINIEGGEVLETPQGNVAKAQGPSHSEGGIDVDVPQGTDIYSDRISIDGKTMAQRKENRAKTLKRLEKLLSKNPNDKLLKNSLQRTKEVHSLEDEQDMNIQKSVRQATQPNREEFGEGGTAWGWNTPQNDIGYWVGSGMSKEEYDATNGIFQISSNQQSDVPPMQSSTPSTSASKSSSGGSSASNPSVGDYVGMAGNLFNAFAPLFNTMANRKGDTPNINAFKNFGKDALEANEDSKQYVKGQRENALTDLKIQKNSARLSNRDNAKSVNTVRALDIMTDMGYNSGMNAIYDNFSKQMMGNLSEQAQLENQQDSVVMQGEQDRDLADRQDRDKFYTQKGQDLVNLGTNLQGLGKNLNTHQENKDVVDLMGQLSKYGLNFTRDKNGKLVLTK